MTAAGSSVGSPGRVLLTGARGFLGRAVLERLVAGGWQVDAVTSTPDGTDIGESETPCGDGTRVCWHRTDLLEPGAGRRLMEQSGAEALIHLAWAPNRGVYESPANLTWMRASMELVEAFAESGGRRAVLAGSSAEYDWRHGVCSEGRTPLAGGGVYGATKRALGEWFAAASRVHELSGAWARTFFLFGPHEPGGRLVASVARSLLAGDTARCSSGVQVRDYLYVGDAADALVRLLESELTGPVNVGSGRPRRVRDLVTALAERCQAAGGTGRVELGALEAVAGEAPLVLADVGRLRDELGWSPPVGFSAGLDRTVTWWQNQLATSRTTKSSA